MNADSYPELLVAWLNRLLLGQELNGDIYSRFDIYELSERGEPRLSDLIRSFLWKQGLAG